MTAVSPILLNFELWTNKTADVPFVPDFSTQKSNHNSTIENHLVWAVHIGRSNLDALCKLCHSKKTAEEAAPRAKADRVRAKQILSRGFSKPAKKNSKLQWNWRLEDE